MGCVVSSSTESDQNQQAKTSTLSLMERQAQAEAERKVAKSLVRNLVREEFGRDFHDFYDLEGPLGEGLQGVVQKVKNKKTGVNYAMKTVPLGHGKNSKAMAQLRSEVDLIRGLDHPNIVRLQEVFETEDSLFLVMDLCTGGDMMTRWERNAKLQYSETEAALTVKKIMNAVRYCHERRVVHRDIKLENLLWDHCGDDAEPQLADFGLGVVFSDDSDVFKDDVGTVFYLAPEVLAKNYTKACDCWSVGVITYMMLSGMPPFQAPTDEGAKLKIRWMKPSFSKELWENVSDEAKDFIKKLLVKNPAKRMTAEEACAHPWIAYASARPSGAREGESESEGEAVEAPWPQRIDRVLSIGAATDDAMAAAAEPLDPKVIRRLSKYKGYGKLKRVALGVIAHSLNPEEIRKLRVEFNKVDVEGRGEISTAALQKAMETAGGCTAEEVARVFDQVDVDHDGVIGFNEFLAASLDVGHVNNQQNLRRAFEWLDDDNTGNVSMANLKRFTGATVDDQTLADQITEGDMRAALLGSEEAGVSYELFQREILKTFSVASLESLSGLDNLPLMASRMKVDADVGELVTATRMHQEDVNKIIKTSKVIVAYNPGDEPKSVGASEGAGEEEDSSRRD